MLDSVQTIKRLIEQRAKTKTGLKVVANIIHKVYDTGKTTKEFLENTPIPFDDFFTQMELCGNSKRINNSGNYFIGNPKYEKETL